MNATTRFSFIGGRSSLDFCNTVDWHLADDPSDRLRRADHVVDWAVAAGIMDPVQADAVRRRLSADPEAAARVLAEARDLRETLFRVFLAAAAGEPAEAHDLARVAEAYAAAVAAAQLRPVGRAYAWSWAAETGEPAVILHAVALDAVRLLESGDLERVKVCSDERCGWVFLDTSRNRSRRWCRMEDCGNRNKVRRHYARRRSGGGDHAG